jgi:2-polyprenyl-6-methoxyphenol hydroxylase-like FAD-dependent oxidoreductase
MNDSHAVVIGGGIAGLLAARVLSGHFSRVTVIERDQLEDESSARKGVPQGRHVHMVLHRGQRVLERLFPGLYEQMGKDGSVSMDVGRKMRWLRLGCVSTHVDTGMLSQFQTRPALEMHVRRRVRQLAAVSFLDRTDVCALAIDALGKRITGIHIRNAADRSAAPRLLAADLVVDASGRGSQLPRWLESLGYPAPKQWLVEINLAYASRIYRRPRHIRGDWQTLICYPDPPHKSRAAYIFPIEHDCIMVTQGDRFSDRPPRNDAEFLEFARGQPHPDVYEVIRDAEPVSEVTSFRFASNQRRHYERLRRFPERLVVLGDAVASLNPLYGQGMTLCALEAMALERYLRRYPLTQAAHKFRRALGRMIGFPWLLIVAEDFRYPQTTGKRPLGAGLINWYTRKLQQLTEHDPEVLRELLYVVHMEKHPLSVYRPRILLKVLGAAIKRPHARRPVQPQRDPAIAVQDRQH